MGVCVNTISACVNFSSGCVSVMATHFIPAFFAAATPTGHLQTQGILAGNTKSFSSLKKNIRSGFTICNLLTRNYCIEVLKKMQLLQNQFHFFFPRAGSQTYFTSYFDKLFRKSSAPSTAFTGLALYIQQNNQTFL
jgi:hypothetical protein